MSNTRIGKLFTTAMRTCNGPCARKLELESNFHKDRTRGGYKAKCKSCSSKAKGVASLKMVRHEPVGRGDFDGTAPEGYVIKGRSTRYDSTGNITGEWVKTDRQKEDEVKALLEAIKGLADDWVKPKPIKKPKGLLSDDLLNTIVLGDPHFGQLSWGDETGQDFDLKIAETNTVAAVDHLVGLAPKAKRALLVSIGDFFHSDSSFNQTTKGTRVDVDSRWPKMLRVGIRAMRRCVDRLLETHEFVTVVCCLGNHDAHSSVMLSLALEQFYENEPRVRIDTAPGKFHYIRHGQVLIGVTHGDTAKMKDLPGIMACDRAKDWGETSQRYFYSGHIHHDRVVELPGVIVEACRTLAPSDAWHKGQGYRSGQDLKLDVIHKKYGRVNRHIVGINQLWDIDAD